MDFMSEVTPVISYFCLTISFLTMVAAAIILNVEKNEAQTFVWVFVSIVMAFMYVFIPIAPQLMTGKDFNFGETMANVGGTLAFYSGFSFLVFGLASKLKPNKKEGQPHD